MNSIAFTPYTPAMLHFSHEDLTIKIYFIVSEMTQNILNYLVQAKQMLVAA